MAELMEEHHFNELLKSVRQMKEIKSGKRKPARVMVMDAVSIKGIRHRLHQSQVEFAFMIGVSPSTLRNWEQGVRQPRGPAQALLKVAEKSPQAVYNALH